MKLMQSKRVGRRNPLDLCPGTPLTQLRMSRILGRIPG
jgi:hypothetical protein